MFDLDSDARLSCFALKLLLKGINVNVECKCISRKAEQQEKSKTKMKCLKESGIKLVHQIHQ